jgi:hypothetical protein
MVVGDGESAVDAALGEVGALDLGEEGVDADPEEGEDGGEQDGPDDDDGGGAVLAAHEALEEGVQVHDHPEGEEELAEQGAPRLVPVVDGVGDARHHADHVDDQQGGGRDEERRPLDHVELREVLVLRLLGRHREVGVDAREHLEEPLEEREQMRRHPPDHPELLIPPPLVDPHPGPPHLQNTRRKNRYEERNEPQTRQVTNLQKRTQTKNK